MVRPFDKLMVLSEVEAQAHHKSIIRHSVLGQGLNPCPNRRIIIYQLTVTISATVRFFLWKYSLATLFISSAVT